MKLYEVARVSERTADNVGAISRASSSFSRPGRYGALIDLNSSESPPT